jgi:hypothetical protein
MISDGYWPLLRAAPVPSNVPSPAQLRRGGASSRKIVEADTTYVVGKKLTRKLLHCSRDGFMQPHHLFLEDGR